MLQQSFKRDCQGTLPPLSSQHFAHAVDVNVSRDTSVVSDEIVSAVQLGKFAFRQATHEFDELRLEFDRTKLRNHQKIYAS